MYETAAYQDDHAPGMLAAYDASGTTNCAGTPVVCQPLWTAPLTSAWGPNVSGGRVYVDDIDTGRLEVFDAAGSTGCSGTPKVCTPLWTAAGTSTGVPSIAGGKVYVTTTLPGVEVFDAAGTTNCTGSPTVCSPLFTVPLPGNVTGSVAVSAGVGYVQQNGFPNNGTTGLYVFDANGVEGCSGTPVVCPTLWRGDSPGFASTSTPAVAGGARSTSRSSPAPPTSSTSSTRLACRAAPVRPSSASR